MVIFKFSKLPAKLRQRVSAAQQVGAALHGKKEHYLVVHADPTQMDSELREMYRDARAAADAASSSTEGRNRSAILLSAPFATGFAVTLGALSAILVGSMVGQLSTVLMYVVAALFIALGLDPVVRWFERFGVRRPLGILLVFSAFLLLVGGLLAVVIPMLTMQIPQLIDSAPVFVRNLNSADWFKDINARLDAVIDLPELLKMGQNFISSPSNLASLAGGVWQAGIGLANGVTAALIVLILSLYFLASLRSIKYGFYSIVPRSKRAQVIDITEQVSHSVGGYVNGMVILAFTNALLGFIMMSIIQVPFAGLVAVGVFLLALIPLIGSVMATVLVSLVALFNSPSTALAAAIYYLIYMQIESYVLTPRIMHRVVSVPGSLVMIGALAGGTLLGLLGALISIPVTAAVLMIVKQVWIPRQALQ